MFFYCLLVIFISYFLNSLFGLSSPLLLCPFFKNMDCISVQILCLLFKIWLFVFLLLSLRSYLYILDTSPLPDVIYIYMLPVYDLS